MTDNRKYKKLCEWDETDVAELEERPQPDFTHHVDTGGVSTLAPRTSCFPVLSRNSAKVHNEHLDA